MSPSVPLSPCTRRPYRRGGRPRRPVHPPGSAQGRLAAALDDVLRGWTDAEVAIHATATVLPLSAATVGRARSGRCVPSAETVKALAAIAGVDPGKLLRLRTEAIWQPFAPVDRPGVTRRVIMWSLGQSLEALRRRGRTAVPYRVLARRAALPEATVRDRLAGIWPAGFRRQVRLLLQLDALLRALGVPDTAIYLWHGPVRLGLARTSRWGVTRRGRWLG
ncbi:hypothetical protein OG496_55255 [Streptomyces sp. NBC_00988]|uniref:hypothetical protein n=1 Tax=Streptomyces sp. NBC_00988 TaxID=2903704 RepID=UPI003865F0FB|nr:hypothetical protein OG496_00030 [Streptomyces sp. NBC_00988]WSX17750.1 hypothetical protein OG496_55255 [Streptomyces sp. NBC_00988]